VRPSTLRFASALAAAVFCVTGASTFALAQQALTQTTLAVALNPVTEGASDTLTATVKPKVGSGVPTGTVTFLYGTVELGSGSLNAGGVATFAAGSAGVAPGAYGISAKYNGSTAYAGSLSATQNVTVRSATTTTFSLSPTSVQLGQPVVLSAHVARNGNSGYPTGTVTFFAGTDQVGMATLQSGAAIVAAPTTYAVLGTYNVTARYNGDTLDAGSTSAAVTASVTPTEDVLTFRNDVSRTGVQPGETTLTPANVSASTFGKLYTFATDGYTFAQPLFVSNYTMSDGKQHNVVYIANATGTIYAFDADNNNPSAGYLWKVSVVPSTEQVVAPSDYFGCTNPYPNSGIIGTPTIDRTRGVMYVVGKSKLVSGSTTTYIQRIHAINLADGTEKLNGPTVIAASVSGTGSGTSGGKIAFNPLTQNQRAALVLANGSVWITWASHCDEGAYHGWTIGYNAGNVSQQTGAYNNTPNGDQGGIWMVQGGISADNAGNLFTVAGNGTFDGNNGGQDLSDSAQRLSIGSNTLTSADWFTPTNEAYLSNNDLDMGTADALLFSDPASNAAPYLLATADKTGRVYLLNRYDLGGFDTGTNSTNGDLQDFTYGSQIFTNLGFFNNRVYVGAGGEPLGAFNFTHGTASTAGYLATTPGMQTPVTFSAGYTTGGLQPMFSANGTSNAIVWGMDLNARVLYAFDANNLATELYSSATNSSRDQPPPTVKMTVPIIAGGHVIVAGQSAVAVYGLLP
jgi:hypothetical protein